MQLQNKRRFSIRQITSIGIMAAVGIVFGYIEFLLPLPIGIPGVKIGLSNIVTLISLFLLGIPESICILLIRVGLSGLLFGNTFALLYSAAGALVSFCAMIIIKCTKRFTCVGISVIGGIMHNMGQLFVAAIVVKQIKIVYYLPVLFVAGLITGTIIGIVSAQIIPLVQRVFYSERDRQ